MTPNPIPPSELLAHAGFLRGLAQTLVRDEHLGEDLVQEVYVRALERPPVRLASLRVWLGRVARNLAINASASRRRRQAREAAVARPEATPSALEEANTREQVRRLTEALLGLPEPFQGTLLLRFYEGLGHEEIARRQGVSPATARTRVHRALARLREELDRTHAGDRSRWLKGIAALALPGLLEAKPAAGLMGLLAMKKILLAAGTLLVMGVLFGAWFLWPPCQPPRVDEAPFAVEIQSGGTASPEDPPAPVARVRIEDDLALASSFWRGWGNWEQEHLPAEDAVQIEVVDGLTGEPVPGASVAWLRTGVFDHMFEREGHPFALDRLLELAAPRRSTDARGMIHFPRRPWRAWVWAWHGERWADGPIAPDQPSPLRFVLQESSHAMLQVVDATGRPQPGILVRLEARRGVQCTCVWKGRTEGLAGVARARFHPGRLRSPMWFESTYSSADTYQPVTLWALLAEPFKDGPEVELDLDAPPAQPIRLELPPSGRVVVRLLDDEGHPLEAEGAAVMTTGSADTWTRAPIRGGEALFPRVGLGGRLELRVSLDDGSRLPHTEYAKGPVRAGEEVVVGIRLPRMFPRGGSAPKLAARLVDEQGRPLGGATVYLRQAFRSESGDAGVSIGPRVLQSDKMGRLEFYPSYGGSERKPGVLSLECTLWLRTTPFGLPEGPAGFIDVALPLPQDGRELGDLVLRGPALLAEGHVRDSHGVPLPGAEVQMRRLNWPFHGRDEGPSSGRTTSDEQGFFRLMGHGAGDLSLAAWKKPFAKPRSWITIPAGSRGVELELASTGQIELRVLCDPGIALEQFTVQFTYGDRVQIFRPFRAITGDPVSGQARLLWVTPGVYTLTLRIAEHVLAVIPDVHVLEGKVTRDPRLLGLDFRGLVDLLELELVDQKLRPVLGQVWVASAAGPEPYRRIYPPGGLSPALDETGSIHDVLVPRGHDRILVGAVGRVNGGYAPREIQRGEGRQRVLLGSGLGIRLRVDLPQGPLQAGGRGIDKLMGVLRPLPPFPSGFDPEFVASLPSEVNLLISGSLFYFPVPFAGRYRLHVLATLEGDEEIELTLDPPHGFEIQVGSYGRAVQQLVLTRITMGL